MAARRFVFFQTAGGRAPALEWMRTLEAVPVVRLKAVMEMLAEHGHTLGRPHAAPLRDGISELRVRVGKARYRLLYFLHGRELVILSHGFSKKTDRVPEEEIERAIRHKDQFEAAPKLHTHGA